MEGYERMAELNKEETESAVVLITELLKKGPSERDYCPLCQRPIYGMTGEVFVRWPERLKELKEWKKNN